MRQDDNIESLPVALGAMHPPDSVFQLRDAEESGRRESADGDHEFRRKQRDLAIEMLGTARDLFPRRNTIAARLFIAPWEATNDRTDMDALAKRLFLDAEACEPCEEASASGVGKRLSMLELMRTGRLSDEHHACVRDSAGDRTADDVRTSAA